MAAELDIPILISLSNRNIVLYIYITALASATAFSASRQLGQLALIRPISVNFDTVPFDFENTGENWNCKPRFYNSYLETYQHSNMK